MEGAHAATFKKTQRREHTRTVQDDDRIFHPTKLVWTYSKKQELRRYKTHRPTEMTSTHTPCRLINQRGSCKIHEKASHDVQTRKIILLGKRLSHPSIINSSSYCQTMGQ
jgi:hypothetical protein